METDSSSFPLSTTGPFPASNIPSDGIDEAAGAAGPSPGAIQLSHGALIAIIVVVAVVIIIGISTGVLFYLAKKKEWKVRENIRRSARKVVTALTPRRSEFPRSVKQMPGKSSRRHVRIDDVPPTPKLRPDDLEKGLAKSTVREASPEGQAKKWSRK